jgi:hypothetical protein
MRVDDGFENPENLRQLETYLAAQRPVPSAGFRGRLRRRVLLEDSMASRLGRVATRRLAALTMALGSALLLCAGLGIADMGPLAPQDVESVVALVVNIIA